LVRAVTRGARLTMTSEAFPGEAFAGQVTAVAPSADAQSRVFAVELSLQNRSGRLRPGMIGAVELSPQTAPAEGVAVPVGAIVRAPDDSGAFTVFVVESGPAGHVARSRSVTLGPSVGNAVLVTRGLAPGERVVTLGAALLTEGEAVRVMP
jgi:RND family efflux transporter MFP subunit